MELHPSTRPRVLVVDDDLVSRTFLQELPSDRYEVEFCSSGEDPITTVAADPPDLILLEVVMNGIAGYEVCASSRRRTTHTTFPSFSSHRGSLRKMRCSG